MKRSENIEWHRMAWDGVVLDHMALDSMGWRGWHVIASDGMVLHRMAWGGMGWHGIASDGIG